MSPTIWPWYFADDVEVAPGVRWMLRAVNGELYAYPARDPESEPALIGCLMNWRSNLEYLLLFNRNGRQARIELEPDGFVVYEPPIQTRVKLPGAGNFHHAMLAYLRLQFYPRWAHAAERRAQSPTVRADSYTIATTQGNAT